MVYQPKPWEIVAALLDYGVPLDERDGWRTRGTQYDASFYGHLNHHDALSEAVSDARALQIMEQGRSDLPGPLCNGWGDSDGTYYLVAYGNANHAGRGEQDVLDRVRAGLAPTGDARLDPDGDGPVGNTWFWGTEWRNAGDGRDPWDQLDTMVRVNAALVDVFDWPSANACIGHKEWTARKIDPAGFDMFEFRRLVSVRLAEHGSPKPPATPNKEYDDMHVPAYIVQATGKNEWWLTDCITKQYIASAEHAAVLRYMRVAKWDDAKGGPHQWSPAVVNSIRTVA